MSDKEPTSRCCAYCYHYGRFLDAPKGILTCEYTGKEKKRPYNYTNCKKFVYVDIITGGKVVGE